MANKKIGLKGWLPRKNAKRFFDLDRNRIPFDYAPFHHWKGPSVLTRIKNWFKGNYFPED